MNENGARLFKKLVLKAKRLIINNINAD